MNRDRTSTADAIALWFCTAAAAVFGFLALVGWLPGGM